MQNMDGEFQRRREKITWSKKNAILKKEKKKNTNKLWRSHYKNIEVGYELNDEEGDT